LAVATFRSVAGRIIGSLLLIETEREAPLGLKIKNSSLDFHGIEFA
jgi:hypothetical protein